MHHRLAAIRASRDRREGERGQILVLFTLCIIVIMLAASLVIDAGLLRTDGARLQNALDAASLAAGQSLPATAANAESIKSTAFTFTRANFNGALTPNDPNSRFLCIVGVNLAGTAPRSVDIPAVCNVPYAVTDPIWECTASVCWAPCGYIGTSTTWRAGDVCNTIELSVSTTRDFTFGRVAGINEGSTGVLSSVACTGPCGGIQYDPVDVAVVIDRTLSMDPRREGGTSGHADYTPQLRNAARAVLQAYDPSIQHVSLGLIGPTDTSAGAACSNGATGKVLPYGTQSTVSLESSISGANTGTNGENHLQLNRPNGTSTGDVLVAVVTVDNLPTATSVTAQRLPTSGTTWPADGDWQLIGRQNSGSTLSQLTYYKVVASGNNYTQYRWSWGSNLRASGGILRFSNVSTADPLGDTGVARAEATTSTTTAGRTMTANAVAGSRYGALVTMFSVDASTTVGTHSGSMTEQFDVNRATSPTTTAAIRALTAGGDSSNKTAVAGTGTTPPTGTAWISRQIELNPVPFVGVDPSVTMTYSAANRTTWIPIGLTGITDLDGQNADIREPYLNPNGTINEDARIVRSIDCILRPNTLTVGTNLATPMDFAWRYLTSSARRDPDTGQRVKTGIIFETDGEPRAASGAGGSSDFTCAAASAAATAAKNAGVEVFTIAFGVDDLLCPDGSGTWSGRSTIQLLASMSTPRSDGLPVITPANAVRCSQLGAGENSDGDNFFCVTESNPADLTEVFRRAAQQLSRATRLVQIYPAPIVTNVTPNPAPAGATVTITGRHFIEVNSVTFGGRPANFSVISETTIRATVPAGTGTNVQVQVTTPGGPSLDTAGDNFTWSP